MARVLLETGADVNFQSSSGKTALMMACLSGLCPKLVSTRPYFTVRPTNLLLEGPVNNLQDGQFITYSTGIALG